MTTYPKIYPNTERGDWIFVPQKFAVGEKVYRAETRENDGDKTVFRPVIIISTGLDYCRFRRYMVQNKDGSIVIGLDLYSFKEAQEIVNHSPEYWDIEL